MNQKIKTLMEKSGLKYTVTEDGGYIRATFSLRNDRTQLVVIDAEPDTFEGSNYEDFDIVSPICLESELTPDKALKLLKAMDSAKAGAVKIRFGMVVVAYDLNPNVSPEVFKNIVGLMAVEADRLEQIVEPNGQKDRF